MYIPALMMAQFGLAANGAGAAADILIYAAIGTMQGRAMRTFAATGNIQPADIGGTGGIGINRKFAVIGVQWAVQIHFTANCPLKTANPLLTRFSNS